MSLRKIASSFVQRSGLYVRMVFAALLLVMGLSTAFAQGAVSLEDATGQVRAAHRGAEILTADPRTREDGSTFYRFKLLTRDGTVKVVRVNASSRSRQQGEDRKRRKRNVQ